VYKGGMRALGARYRGHKTSAILKKIIIDVATLRN
jgi:hypothetical protein